MRLPVCDSLCAAVSAGIPDSWPYYVVPTTRDAKQNGRGKKIIIMPTSARTVRCTNGTPAAVQVDTLMALRTRYRRPDPFFTHARTSLAYRFYSYARGPSGMYVRVWLYPLYAWATLLRHTARPDTLYLNAREYISAYTRACARTWFLSMRVHAQKQDLMRVT